VVLSGTRVLARQASRRTTARIVPPTVGFIAGVSIGSSPSKKHDSGTSYGLAGAAIGLVIDAVLVVVAVSAIDGLFGAPAARRLGR
jgi:hypothetical protein